MGGTILNLITVAVGSLIGLSLGSRFPERMGQSVVTGLGLVTVVVGFGNANRTGNIIIPLLSLVGGIIIGELLDIDGALNRFAGWLQHRVSGVSGVSPVNTSEISGGETTAPIPDRRARFINGFVTASLLYCIGPLSFVGSIQDGMGLAIGFQQLAIKSVLDGFASIAFAASMGVGVLFSLITIIVVQGGLALLGSALGSFLTDPQINELTAVGGLLLIGLSLNLLDIKKPRVANMLPALLIAPLMVAAAGALGINIYPL